MAPGLAAHLTEAAQLNRARRWSYARASRGLSLPLSSVLIAAETAGLPLAAWVDARAARWNRAGVPIVAADFVSMTGVDGWQTPPRWCGRTSREANREVRTQLRVLALAVLRVGDDFEGLRHVAARVLAALRAIETRERAHLAMCCHLVESIGLGAEHGAVYAAQSRGGTNALARDLLRLQALSLAIALAIDRRAQRLHARGLGIVVNDVPAIPFGT